MNKTFWKKHWAFLTFLMVVLITTVGVVVSVFMIQDARNEKAEECQAAGGTYVAVVNQPKHREYACLDAKVIDLD